MKKSITILTLLAGAAGAYAQGTLTFGDYGNGFTIDVFSPQVSTPTLSTYGNSVYDNPAGSTVYTGVGIGGTATGTGPTAYANGNLFTIALYAAPGVGNTSGLTAAEASGTPVVTSLFQTSGGTGTANTGVNGNDSAGVWALNFNSANKTTLAGFTGGATLQLEAWYSGPNGTITFAQASAPGSGDPFGSSVVGTIAALGGTGSPPATTPTLASSGITSFSMEIVTSPEPSTIALGVMGASAFLFRRKK